MYIVRNSRIYLDLFAQTPDMDIHGPGITRIVIPPNSVQQVFSALYFVRMEYEQFQQVKLFRRQVNLFAVDMDSPAVTVNL